MTTESKGDPDFPPDYLMVPDDDRTRVRTDEDGMAVNPGAVDGSDDEPMLTPEDAPDGLTNPETPIP